MNTRTRLKKPDWLHAGFHALVADGPAALKAEPLSRRLGTTKGSFYWHFKDVPDFHDALLQTWEAQAYADIVAELQTGDTAHDRLKRLDRIAFGTDPRAFGEVDVEPAIRAWARSEEKVSSAVARVDEERLTYLGALLRELDLPNPEIPHLLYGGAIGLKDLAASATPSPQEALASLIDMVLALR